MTGRQPGRTRIDAAAEHGLTTFVGRRRELELLEALLAKTRGGLGQIVGVVGEAGVGKSRLLLEFRRLIQREDITSTGGYERALRYVEDGLRTLLPDCL